MSEQLSIIDLIINASVIVQLVMLVLVVMSIYSWTIVFAKRRLFRKAQVDIKLFQQAFAENPVIDNVYRLADTTKSSLFFKELLISGFDEFKKSVTSQDDNRASRAYQKMQLLVNQKLDTMSTYLSSLAMVGSISPFVGLFGTVWGIMHSFIGLSTVKQATIAVVAPGIAEALVATAIGLFVAIPATMAYNTFMTKMDELNHQYQAMVDEFYIQLQRK